jgi:hypothetical protein
VWRLQGSTAAGVYLWTAARFLFLDGNKRPYVVFVYHIMYDGVTLGLGVVLGMDLVRVVFESKTLYPRASNITRSHHML